MHGFLGSPPSKDMSLLAEMQRNNCDASRLPELHTVHGGRGLRAPEAPGQRDELYGEHLTPDPEAIRMGVQVGVFPSLWPNNGTVWKLGASVWKAGSM